MNTYESIDGKRFVLLQDPYIDGGGADTHGYYTAHAMCPDDIQDENDCVPAYRVYWDILEEWDGDDESNACDWDVIKYWEQIGVLTEEGRLV